MTPEQAFDEILKKRPTWLKIWHAIFKSNEIAIAREAFVLGANWQKNGDISY